MTTCPRPTEYSPDGRPIKWCGGRLCVERHVDENGQRFAFIECRRCGERWVKDIA